MQEDGPATSIATAQSSLTMCARMFRAWAEETKVSGTPKAKQHRNVQSQILGVSPWLAEIVPRTALTVLWLAMHRHEIDSMVAQGLVEAAGLSGRQNGRSSCPVVPE